MTFSVPKITLPSVSSIRAYRPKGGAVGFSLLLLWAVGGIVTLAVPRSVWSASAQTYYSAYGQYIEYEQQQRQYEQQQNNNNNNNGDDDGAYKIQDCKWFQWQCRRQNYQYFEANGNGDNNAIQVPTWYEFLGGDHAGGDEMRRYQEENGLISTDETSAAVTFVNGYTTFLFLALLLYGGHVFLNGRAYGGLVVAMAFFSQFSFLMMLLIPQGVIKTDNRDLEDSIYGWYGQTAVLMVYRDFAYLIFCLSSMVVLGLVTLALWYRNKDLAKDEQSVTKPATEDYTPPGVYYKADDNA